MPKKERVHINRSDAFDAVDEELTDAMGHLDEAISRVQDVLTVDEEEPAESQETAPPAAAGAQDESAGKEEGAA